jgi:branched-chain amino acid transport system ATP-binding protein
MFNVIRHLSAEGLPILPLEQNVEQPLEIAARGLILESGVFALHGAAMTLREDPELRRVYLAM